MRRVGTKLDSVLFLALMVSLAILCACLDAGAYEDSECLACHRDYGRSPETMPENVSGLYVDQDEWEKDVHYESGLVCDDCHMDATTETHPEKGLDKVNCGECHDEVVEGYQQTPHWTARAGKGKSKPDCADCHFPHTIRYKDDPESSVFKGNVKTACLACHEERKPSTMLFNKLAVFRISAHRKSDISNLFDPSECVNCHYIQAVGHGEDPLAETNCGQCHSPAAKGGNLIFGPFHLDPSLKDQLLVFSVEILNIIVILGVLITLVVWIVRGFLKVKSDKTAQQPEG